MKRKVQVILLISSSICLFGCGISKNNSNEIKLETHSLEAVLQETQSHILDQTSVSDKELVIDADVELGGVDYLAEVTLKTDKERIQKFVEDFIKTKDPNISESTSESGERNWDYKENGELLARISLNEWGFTSYLDVTNNLNCPYTDGEHLFEYGYITENIPEKIRLTADEAGKECAELLNQYSCFTFKPWNVYSGLVVKTKFLTFFNELIQMVG